MIYVSSRLVLCFYFFNCIISFIIDPPFSFLFLSLPLSLYFRGSSPQIPSEKRSSSLIVNVTRTPTAATDLAPFKVVTWTNIVSQFSSESYEVYRSAGDFQWLHDVLQDNCPERAVPPLRTTISLDGKTIIL